MGILDQLYEEINSNTRDASVAPVDTQLTQDEWVHVSTTFAGHQAFRNGYNTKELRTFLKSGVIDPNLGSTFAGSVLSRPRFGTKGTISALTTLNIINNWERLYVKQQLEPIAFRPTVEDYIDGGIKKGAKVVIQIVSENDRKNQSPYELVQAKISGGYRGNSPVKLIFDKFSVVSINEPSEARYQLHQTFGADILQDFGRRPRMMMLSGNVLNGKAEVRQFGEIRSMDWKNAMQRFYDRYASLHANRVNRQKVRIFAQDTVYDGYLLNLVSQVTAETQSVSQVTITLLISRIYFPNQNDSAIPGFLDENGFRIGGASTPEDFMPEARLEYHFQLDPAAVINAGKADSINRLTQLENKLRKLDPFLRDGLDDVARSVLANEKSSYVTPVAGYRIHKLLEGGSLEGNIRNFGTITGILREDIEVFNQSIDAVVTERGGLETEIATPAPTARLDFVDTEVALRQRQARLRSQRSGLLERVSNMNQLALDFVNEIEYFDHLTNLVSTAPLEDVDLSSAILNQNIT